MRRARARHRSRPRSPQRRPERFSVPLRAQDELGHAHNPVARKAIRAALHTPERPEDRPGYKKEEIQAELKDGYLTIRAVKAAEQKKEEGKFIRRERYSGSCQRSFFVGKDVTQEDIKAEFKDGILRLQVPKKEAKPEVEENKYISIE